MGKELEGEGRCFAVGDLPEICVYVGKLVVFELGLEWACDQDGGSGRAEAEGEEEEGV